MFRRRLARPLAGLAVVVACAVAVWQRTERSTAAAPAYELNDVHVHLTNYVQKGDSAKQLLAVMGTKVGRAALFGIPLQQQWSHRVSGAFAPTYYLETDAPLYYYSFTDANVAMAYRSLSKAEQARFDPMITGFNPTDMYAVDHIRRVLTTFPGVFVGIGEFTIHKEFVSAKIAGDTASLNDPALDRVFDFAGEVGLVSILHNDVTTAFPKKGARPVYFEQLLSLFRRHPTAKIIWAHVGLGRVIQPIEYHAAHIEEILADPSMAHVAFDISWTETAKYVTSSPEALRITADLIGRYPDRFLFGTDEVAPTKQEQYLGVYVQYEPLFRLLGQEVADKVRKRNYERLFDEARRRVRAWERANLP